jgi:hypothetical protein
VRCGRLGLKPSGLSSIKATRVEAARNASASFYRDWLGANVGTDFTRDREIKSEHPREINGRSGRINAVALWQVVAHQKNGPDASSLSGYCWPREAVDTWTCSLHAFVSLRLLTLLKGERTV